MLDDSRVTHAESCTKPQILAMNTHGGCAGVLSGRFASCSVPAEHEHEYEMGVVPWDISENESVSIPAAQPQSCCCHALRRFIRQTSVPLDTPHQ